MGQRLCLVKHLPRSLGITCCVSLTPGNRRSPQVFYSIKERIPSLLTQYLPQQRAQRSYVAPQRSLFGVAATRF
jgi:hypothetical protein